MANIITNPGQINDKLNRSRSPQVKIGNNTTAEHRSDGMPGHVIRLHGHPIVTTNGSGEAESFSLCGYGTVTTRERVNQFLPQWVSVCQRDYVQGVSISTQHNHGFDWLEISTDKVIRVADLRAIRDLPRT